MSNLEIAASRSRASTRASARAAVDRFVAQTLSIARSVDPKLAIILSEAVDSAELADAPPAKPARDRESGLKLCLAMLRYVRPEAVRVRPVDRMDDGIHYIESELASL